MDSTGKLRGICEDLRDSCGESAGSSALRVQLCVRVHVLQHQMVRTSIDGKLSLGDLIKELLKTDADNAWHHKCIDLDSDSTQALSPKVILAYAGAGQLDQSLGSGIHMVTSIIFWGKHTQLYVAPGC